MAACSCFGVRESDRRAAELTPFAAELAAGAESRILGSVGEKVAPVPVGLAFRWINSARGGVGYLVAMVPRSPDVPHAVRMDRGKLGYPTRDADQTRWMSEAELASRYRDRFSLRQNRANRVDDVHAAALGGITRSNRLLLAMTLVPEIPGRAPVGKQGVDDVRAWTEERPWFPSMLSLDYNTVRVGLRKVLASSALNELAEADYGHVELHEDGSGAVVVDLSGGLVLGQPAIRDAPGNTASALVRWVEAAVISGLDLLTRHASQRARCSGDASVRLEMLAGAGWVMTLSEPTPISGEDRRAPGARLLRGDPPQFQSTVDLDAVSTSSVGLLTTARLLAVDLLSVFGVGPDILAVSGDATVNVARFGREAPEVATWLERTRGR